MFVLCVIAGLMVGLSLGWAVNVNSNNCPLYANISLKSDRGNQSITVDEVGIFIAIFNVTVNTQYGLSNALSAVCDSILPIQNTCSSIL